MLTFCPRNIIFILEYVVNAKNDKKYNFRAKEYNNSPGNPPQFPAGVGTRNIENRIPRT